MKIRYLEDLANVKAGEVVSQPTSTAEFLIQRGLAERAEGPESTEEIEEPAQAAPVKRGPGRPRKAAPKVD